MHSQTKNPKRAVPLQSELGYVSMGCNSGNCEATLLSALKMLDSAFTIVALSQLYVTAPQVIRDQADFLNCACCFFLPSPESFTPKGILKQLQGIENFHGRDRSREQKGGARTLDIDIIFLADVVMQSRELTIPHPLYMSRRFVLVPLLDIAPDLRDPQSKKPIVEYAQKLEQDQSQGIYPKESTLYNAFASALRSRF